MAHRVTVVCPHCGSTGSYQVGTMGNSGKASNYVSCTQCHKGFAIYMYNGSVDSVKK